MSLETASFSAAPSHHREPTRAAFHESGFAIAERWLLGAAWAMAPSRIAGVPNMLRLCLREWMAPDHALSDPERALDQPPGLAGIAHDLSVDTLARAYARGLFPLAHAGPVKWWSPPHRSLLLFDELHIAKRLRRQIRQSRYTVTFDGDIAGVLKACAGARTGRWHLTWITPKIMRAYADAFDAGLVHSFEVWNEAGELAGGGYGVATGGAFSTESQFSREPNTSKIGFTVLNFHLSRWGFAFNDGKLMTPTTRDMGFRELPRADYLARLAIAARLPGKPGRWSVEADARDVADWQPGR
jgi:leucyl/phenylalanyl-tRNA--protein transferase